MNIKPVLGNDKQTGMRRIAAAAVVLSFVSFVLVAMFDRGSLVGQLFFRDMTDTFMDYFNCLPGVAMRRPYDTQSMYPPLSEVVFYLFSKILPDKMLFEMAPRAMRTEQIPILSLMLYLAIPIAVTVIALSDYIKTGNAEKRLVIIAFLVSSPFIYLLERGNVLIYSFAAAVVFICYYDSDKKWQREMALIALAVSAGIKLYPAVLGILLVRDRRWKDWPVRTRRLPRTVVRSPSRPTRRKGRRLRWRSDSLSTARENMTWRKRRWKMRSSATRGLRGCAPVRRPTGRLPTSAGRRAKRSRPRATKPS